MIEVPPVSKVKICQQAYIFVIISVLKLWYSVKIMSAASVLVDTLISPLKAKKYIRISAL